MQGSVDKVIMGWRSWWILQWFDPNRMGPWYKMCCNFFGVLGRYKDQRQFFLDHYNHVRAVVLKERLLEFDAPMGWAPLCEFLGRDVPDEPYPRFNNMAGFVKFLRKMCWTSFRIMMRKIGLIAVPLVAAELLLITISKKS